MKQWSELCIQARRGLHVCVCAGVCWCACVCVLGFFPLPGFVELVNALSFSPNWAPLCAFGQSQLWIRIRFPGCHPWAIVTLWCVSCSQPCDDPNNNNNSTTMKSSLVEKKMLICRFASSTIATAESEIGTRSRTKTGTEEFNFAYYKGRYAPFGSPVVAECAKPARSYR